MADDALARALAEDPKGLLEHLIAKEARLSGSRSFAAFVKQAWRYVPQVEPLVWGWHMDVICLHLESLMRGGIEQLVVNIAPGSGKPVWEEEQVLERRKGRIRLADVRVGDEILTHRARFRRVLAVHEQGIRSLLKVTTHTGRSLRTAEDHSYLTTRGWIAAGSLRENDVLALVAPRESCGAETVSPEEARLLGYFVGDGHTLYKKSSITTDTPEMAEDIRRCAESLGFRIKVEGKKGTTAVAVHVLPPSIEGARRWIWEKHGPNPVHAWLERHGLRDRNSYTKRPPSAIMDGNERVVSEFLGAYWSCDGSIERRGDDRADLRSVASTVNNDLAQDVQHLLLRLGIVARLRRQVRRIRTKRQGETYVFWNVDITTADDVARFGQRVPMVHPGKTARVAGYPRTHFDRIIREDPVEAIVADGAGACRCLTVEEDESFVVGDIAVHNSVFTSVLLPAWIWTWWPKCQFLFGSYSHAFVVRDARRCMDLIRSDWYQKTYCAPLGWNLREDYGAADNFSNTAGGVRFASSVGGAGAGIRAHFIAIDDPINIGDTFSEAARRDAIDWMSQTLSQRFIMGYPMRLLLTMQRLHEEDPAGWMSKQSGVQTLCLPTEFEPHSRCITYHTVERRNGHIEHVLEELWRDPRTEAGELLFPALRPRARVEQDKIKLGSFGFASQHQQRPSPEGGGIFKIEHWRFWTSDDATMNRLGLTGGERPRGCYTGPARIVDLGRDPETQLISVDATFRETKAGSYVVIQVWARVGADRLLLYQVRRRMDFTDTVAALLNVIELFPSAIRKLIEGKANGDAIISTLEKTHSVSGCVAVPVLANKQQRAHAMQPHQSSGHVLLPDGAPWLSDYIQEHAQFPKGASDDQVDATSQGLQGLEAARTAWEEWADSDEEPV